MQAFMPPAQVRRVTYSVKPSNQMATEVYLFDPATKKFGSPTTLSPSRIKHTVTALPDGRALIAGGSSAVLSAVSLSTALLFDPDNPPGTQISVGTSRQEHAALLPANGKVLIAGGKSGATPLGSGVLIERRRHCPTSDY